MGSSRGCSVVAVIQAIADSLGGKPYTTVHKPNLLKPEYVLVDTELHFTSKHLANADGA